MACQHIRLCLGVRRAMSVSKVDHYLKMFWRRELEQSLQQPEPKSWGQRGVVWCPWVGEELDHRSY